MGEHGMTIAIDIAAELGSALPHGIAFGTNVRTVCGWRRVENIRRGDLIVTRHQGLQPVRLIWTRSVSAAEIAADPSLAPVRLMPRALGPMRPRRDLLLASGQQILVPGWRIAGATAGCRLVTASEIAGRTDAVFVDRSPEQVSYVTFVFDSHQVVHAEGLPVGSFCPTPSAARHLDEAQRLDLLRTFPELGRSPSAYPPSDYQTAAGDRLRLDTA